MIQLVNKNLDPQSIEVLDYLQAQIDALDSFQDKAKESQKLWKTKGDAKGQKTFEIIRDTLREMCVNVGICNYCEQNEANDIEHVYPKSFFPHYTFKWTNYILACKQCNSAFKLDRCHCIDNENKICKVNRGSEPINQNVALINPRIENPSNFMMINLETFKFIEMPELHETDNLKAFCTIEVLHLNTRETLIVARKSAMRHYYDMLDRLTVILNSENIEDLKRNLSPVDNRFNLNKPLFEIKEEIKLSYKNYITTYQHPSVWLSIKLVASKTNQYWIELFNKIPEAINW